MASEFVTNPSTTVCVNAGGNVKKKSPPPPRSFNRVVDDGVERESPPPRSFSREIVAVDGVLEVSIRGKDFEANTTGKTATSNNRQNIVFQTGW